MALRGVRNSWLIFAKNILLDKFAASAASFALVDSLSTSLRSLIFRINVKTS